MLNLKLDVLLKLDVDEEDYDKLSEKEEEALHDNIAAEFINALIVSGFVDSEDISEIGVEFVDAEE